MNFKHPILHFFLVGVVSRIVIVINLFCKDGTCKNVLPHISGVSDTNIEGDK